MLRSPVPVVRPTPTSQIISVSLVQQEQPLQKTRLYVTAEQDNIGLTEIVHLVRPTHTALQGLFSVFHVRDIRFPNLDQKFVIVEQASSGQTGAVQFVRKTHSAQRVLTIAYHVPLALLHLPGLPYVTVWVVSTGPMEFAGYVLLTLTVL